MGEFYSMVYRIVAMIPPGSVMTYGQIAVMAGNPRASRAVGYALCSVPAGINVPWHRVVNAKGELSLRRTLQGDDNRCMQRILLESEGVKFNEADRINLKQYQLIF